MTDKKNDFPRPLPTPSQDNESFWEGLKQHEFRIQKCKNCDNFRWLPKPACPNCMSEDFEWIKSSGEGTVWSFSVVHRSLPPFMGDAPFVSAVVELKENPRKCLVLARLADCSPEEVRIGMPVKVVFEDIPDKDITMYKFAPA